MKKKIFGIVIVLAVAAVTAFNATINKDTDVDLSTISLANVEALAQGESGSKKTCYNTITSKEGSQIMYCPTCSWVSGTDSWVSSKGEC